MDDRQEIALATSTAPGLVSSGPISPPIDRAGSGRRPRIAYLTFSSGEYDARTMRMARSSVAAGFEVTVYARWHRGFPQVEQRDGYRVVRAPFEWQLAVPGLRGRARRRAAAEMAADAAMATGVRAVEDEPATDGTATAEPPPASGADGVSISRLPRRLAGRVKRRILRPLRGWWKIAKNFPLRPLGWAAALDAVTEPADIWHGMWAGSLPALARMRRRHGGRTVYDSRDVFMQSRDYARLGWPGKAILAGLERRWARAADRVLTVNEPYAGLLEEQLGVPRPPVVMNCPGLWDVPEPKPNLIREALGLSDDMAIALYQGHFISERGIEQSMAAILEVPNVVLVLLGFGRWLDRLTDETSRIPYLGRVRLLPAVPPDDLLPWTASADVSLMAIQPTTVNHVYTTPQKLFESIAAGVPVVASDLPGMASIVRSTGVGVVCDPTSPAAIAAAIREIVGAPAAERAARRARVLEAFHGPYHWEAQLEPLFGLYRELLPAGVEIRAIAPR